MTEESGDGVTARRTVKQVATGATMCVTLVDMTYCIRLSGSSELAGKRKPVK